MSRDASSNERRPGFRVGKLFSPMRESTPTKSRLERAVQPTPESPSRKLLIDKTTEIELSTESDTSPNRSSGEKRNIFRIGRREDSDSKEPSNDAGKSARRRPSGAFHLIRNSLFSQSKNIPDETPDTSEMSRSFHNDPCSDDADNSLEDAVSSIPLSKSETLPRHPRRTRSPRPPMTPVRRSRSEDTDTGSEMWVPSLSQKLKIGQRKAEDQRTGIERVQLTESGKNRSAIEKHPRRASFEPTLSQKLLMGKQEIQKNIKERQAPRLQSKSTSPTLVRHLRQSVDLGRQNASPSVQSKISCKNDTSSHARHQRSGHRQIDSPERHDESDSATVQSRGRSRPSPLHRGSKAGHTSASVLDPLSPHVDTPSKRDRPKSKRSTDSSYLSQRQNGEPSLSPIWKVPSADRAPWRPRDGVDGRSKKSQDEKGCSSPHDDREAVPASARKDRDAPGDGGSILGLLRRQRSMSMNNSKDFGNDKSTSPSRSRHSIHSHHCVEKDRTPSRSRSQRTSHSYHVAEKDKSASPSRSPRSSPTHHGSGKDKAARPSRSMDDHERGDANDPINPSPRRSPVSKETADPTRSESRKNDKARRRALSLDESLSNRRSLSKHSASQDIEVDECKVRSLCERSARNTEPIATPMVTTVSDPSPQAAPEDLSKSGGDFQDGTQLCSPRKPAKHGVVSSSKYRVPKTPSGRLERVGLRASPGQPSGSDRSQDKAKSGRAAAETLHKVGAASPSSSLSYLPSAEHLLTSRNLTTQHYHSVNMMASKNFQSPFGDQRGDASQASRGRSESPGPLSSSDAEDPDSAARRNRTRALKTQLRNLEKLNASRRSKSPSMIDRSERSEHGMDRTSHSKKYQNRHQGQPTTKSMPKTPKPN
jgi:hypothetical protein